MARPADKTGTTGKSTRRTTSTASVRRTAAKPPIAATQATEAPAVAAIAPPTSLPVAKPAARKTATAPAPKGFGDLTAIGKANFDALVQANAVFTQGFENLSKEFVSLTQASLANAAAAAKALLTAKTLPELVTLNTDFTRTQYEILVANSTKLGSLTLKLATDTAAPITARAGIVA